MRVYRLFKLTAAGVLIALVAALPVAAQAQDFAKGGDELLQRLQGLIRIDTSNPPGNETKGAEYLKAVLDKEGISSEIIEAKPGRGNLVARLKGNGSKQPILLMGHMDTVGVERDKWTVDPFAAVIKDGYLYGRGAIDDKIDVVSMFQVFLMIHRAKLPLDRDIIYLAEAAEEGGDPVGIDFLVEKHSDKIACEFAINEGGEILLQGGKPLYVGVQTAEKVPKRLKLVARGISGHGSMPRVDNPIAHLAAAIAKVAAYQPPMKMNDTTRTYFQRLAEVSAPEEAFLLKNIDDPLIGPVVQETFRRGKQGSHVYYNSLLRNSISPNMVQGGFRVNVIPADAEAALDVRMLPGEDIELLKTELRRIIDDPAVEVADYEAAGFPEAPATRLDTDFFRAIENAQKKVFPEAITLPTMSTGATDSAKIRAKGVQAYGVGTLRTDDDESRMHGNDERVLVSGLPKYLEFLYRTITEVAVKKQ